MSLYDWHHQQRRKFTQVGKWQPKSSLFLSNGLRDVGVGAITVFVPIYLFKELGDISLVFVFMSVYHLTVIVGGFWVARIIRKIGLDWSGFIGGLLRVMFFLFLMKKGSVLWLAALMWGLTSSFTWLTHHYYLAVSRKDGKFGKTVAHLMLIDRWLMGLMPLIGGYILKTGGFNLMFIIAMFFLGLSGLPLFLDRFNKKNMGVSWDRVVGEKWFKSHKRVSLAFLAAGAKSEIVQTVWPIYLFLIVKDYIKVGIIQTASLLIASVVLIWLSKQVDKGNKKMMRPAVAANAINLFVRGAVSSGLGLFFLESLYRLVANFVWVPFDAHVYETAVREQRMEFFIRRAWLINIGGLMATVLLAGVFAAGLSWNLVFGLGGLSMALVGVVKLKSKNEK